MNPSSHGDTRQEGEELTHCSALNTSDCTPGRRFCDASTLKNVVATPVVGHEYANAVTRWGSAANINSYASAV